MEHQSHLSHCDLRAQSLTSQDTLIASSNGVSVRLRGGPVGAEGERYQCHSQTKVYLIYTGTDYVYILHGISR